MTLAARTLCVRLLAATALLLACKPTPPLRVLEPASEALLSVMPLTFTIDADTGVDLASLTVELDGVDITALFEARPPANDRVVLVARDVWTASLQQAGTHELHLRGTILHAITQAHHSFVTEGDPYADAVAHFTPGNQSGFGAATDALGPPYGEGSFVGGLHVVSLGAGGVIELEMLDNVVYDGPGPDLAVFENAFLEFSSDLVTLPPFAEPAQVSVSQDGVTWVAFPCDLETPVPPYFPGCAGVYPVLANADDPQGPHPTEATSVPIEDLVGVGVFEFLPPEGAGGDLFDLADVGLAWARFVRIESAPFLSPVAGADNGGFDLDALAALHSVSSRDDDGSGVPDALEP